MKMTKFISINLCFNQTIQQVSKRHHQKKKDLRFPFPFSFMIGTQNRKEVYWLVSSSRKIRSRRNNQAAI